MQQLLWIETVLKGVAGLVLALLPLTAARILGLPAAASGLWPRLLGALLVGIAAATYIEGALPGSRGLGMAGLLAINLAAAAMLIALMVLGRATDTRRGGVVLGALAIVLVLLSLVEIAAI